MLLLGIDVGTSFIKVSAVDAATGTTVATGQYPDTEVPIDAPAPGWAEQSPDTWWANVQQAILTMTASYDFDAQDIRAIGIAYQMHGLVLVDENRKVLRPAIIWCDSRAVTYGEQAFATIGKQHCLSKLLNSPGNFTAAKLAWVKEHEPHIYKQIHYAMLPGDFIAMELTAEITTTSSALSEGIFWDFEKSDLSTEVLDYFGFDPQFIPPVRPVFSPHGYLKKEVADKLGLKAGIPVSYKAGDQPNNAFSLGVVNPGEVAAGAGTSGVIYGVSDKLVWDRESRINSFAHVNHNSEQTRIGVLMCINGAGSLNNWVHHTITPNTAYNRMNDAAARIAVGAEGLTVLPFGNGAERMLGNKLVGAHMHHLDFNRHTQDHVYRAVQEGIAFAFRYGLDIMRENGMQPSIIRAGRASLFLSPVFQEAFVSITRVPVALYDSDGSVGAALGAGLGAKIFASEQEAVGNRQPLMFIEPEKRDDYEDSYNRWLQLLNNRLEAGNDAAPVLAPEGIEPKETF